MPLFIDASPEKPECSKLAALFLLPWAEATAEGLVMWLLRGENGILIPARVSRENICVCVWYVECATRLFGLGR